MSDMGSLTTYTEISNDPRRAIIRLKEKYVSLYNQFVLGEKNISYAVADGLIRQFDGIVEKIHGAEEAVRSGHEEDVIASVALGESALLEVQKRMNKPDVNEF
jgi:ribosomal protein L35AE/L33A